MISGQKRDEEIVVKFLQNSLKASKNNRQNCCQNDLKTALEGRTLIFCHLLVDGVCICLTGTQ
jgi:hypothetical protein